MYFLLIERFNELGHQILEEVNVAFSSEEDRKCVVRFSFIGEAHSTE